MSMQQGKKIAILQSNYIPWKGYFDIVAAADEFVIFDEAQFTRADWRNRNRIVVNGQTQWLTIPVKTSGMFRQPINAIEVADKDWAARHWKTLRHNYRRTPHFSRVGPIIESLYLEAAKLILLTDINELFLRELAKLIELPALFLRADVVPHCAASATDRLVEICAARDATIFLSGPAARAYLDVDRFVEAGIELRFANYSGYQEYKQQSVTFDHRVSVLDLLFNCGRDARRHLKSLGNSESFFPPTLISPLLDRL